MIQFLYMTFLECKCHSKILTLSNSIYSLYFIYKDDIYVSMTKIQQNQHISPPFFKSNAETQKQCIYLQHNTQEKRGNHRPIITIQTLGSKTACFETNSIKQHRHKYNIFHFTKHILSIYISHFEENLNTCVYYW